MSSAACHEIEELARAPRDVLTAVVAEQPDGGWWVEPGASDPDGDELSDPVAELTASPPPAGAVLWCSDGGPMTPCAVLTEAGWRRASARRLAFAAQRHPERAYWTQHPGDVAHLAERPWWSRLARHHREALAQLVLGDAAADLRCLDFDPLPAAAARAIALGGGEPGRRRSAMDALRVVEAELQSAHRELLRRLAVGPLDLAAEADPVQVIRDAHGLNARVLLAGGWCLVALVDDHLVYQPRKAGDVPPASPREACDELMRRDGALGRWWWVDAPSMTPGDVELGEGVAWVGVDGTAAELGARIEIATGQVAAECGVGRVVAVVGELALLDVCPGSVARAARWWQRSVAQRIGEAIVEDDEFTPGAAEWAAVSVPAPTSPGFFGGTWSRRVDLERLPSAPPASAEIIGPPAFSAGWARREAVSHGRDGSVRGRRGPAGRRRLLSLEDYAFARAAVVAAGGAGSDPEVLAWLAAERELVVSRGAVIGRRRELQHLLADVDEEELLAGLGAIAATMTDLPRLPSPTLMPFAGGKASLLAALFAELPDVVEEYCECYLGSGVVFLALAEAGRVKRARLSDADPDIVHLWRELQRDAGDVHDAAMRWPETREGYLDARAAIPRLGGVVRAGAVLRVGWGSFNGLWRRARSTGLLNMPAGTRRRGGARRIEITREQLCQIGSWLADADISHRDGPDAIASLQGRGVALCDCPYWPVAGAGGAGFCGYVGAGFQAEAHVRLVAALRTHAEAGGLGLLCNASVRPVVALARGAGARVRWVAPHRSVAAKAKARKKAVEVIVRVEALVGDD